MSTCPICSLDDGSVQVESLGDRTAVECTRCGSFEISNTSITLEQARTSDISAWLRQINIEGGSPPFLTAEILKRQAESLPKYSALEKQRLLLFAIEKLTNYPGDWVNIDRDHSISLAWAHNFTEFQYCVNCLEERDFITSGSPSRPLKNWLAQTQAVPVRITSDGWEYIDQYKSNKTSQEQAFVAMSFNEALDSIFDNGIFKGVRNAGFRPYRIDRENHNKRIDAKIIAEIKKSRFLVADVTEHKQGVYYEAGFAQGQGMEVIWTVRDDQLKAAHFDTRQYRHIVWNSYEQLAQDLTDMIQAVIGQGPLPVD